MPVKCVSKDQTSCPGKVMVTGYPPEKHKFLLHQWREVADDFHGTMGNANA